MILVDASVWIAHFRLPSERLLELLKSEQVLGHPFVVGEVGLGTLRNRHETLLLLSELPAAQAARDREVMQLVERRRLFGRGIGYVDAHLLAATLLTPETMLWSLDRRLMEAARDLGVAALPV